MPHQYKKEEIEILARIADEVLLPNRKYILARWIKSYASVDTEHIFTYHSFAKLCEEEFVELTKAMSSQNLNAYFTHAAEVGSKLAEARFAFTSIIIFMHALEESYTELLLEKFPRIKKLSFVLITLDNFLHDILTTIATSYFNNVRERLTEELSRWRILEQAFRPRLAPKVNNLDIGVVYASATEKALIGGDFYDFFYLPSGNLAFAIGDVSGKGIEAATTAAMTKFMFRGFAFEFSKPVQVLKRLNKALSYTLGPTELVTAIFTTFNPQTAIVTMAGAGHPPPFYLPFKKTPKMIELGGLVLGVLPQLTCFETSLQLHNGDLLLFYTDGLAEARGEQGFFGYERISNFLSQTKITTAQKLVDDLLKACLKFTNNKLSDDLAMVCFYKKS